MTNPLSNILAVSTSCAALGFVGALATERTTSSIDPSRTHIGFIIDATGFPRTQGQFHEFKGQLSVNFDRPSLSRVAFTVETASIDVGSPSFNGTLRGPAFLNSEHFPVIAFESTSVEKIDDKTARVIGDLTMLGVTRPLQVDVDVRRGANGGSLGFEARAHIDRLAFGMNSGFPIISRDVDLTVSSEGVSR
jgi:polyisoprenoid-binding protein YceI